VQRSLSSRLSTRVKTKKDRVEESVGDVVDRITKRRDGIDVAEPND
jgi:hypothetical protein